MQEYLNHSKFVSSPGEKSVNVFVCVAEWLFECTVQKLVLVITCLETNEVLERWQFDIECDKSAKESRSAPLLSTAAP